MSRLIARAVHNTTFPTTTVQMSKMRQSHSYANGSEFPSTTPGTLRVYSMRHCPYAERTRLHLAHRNIPYETININLVNKPDWFLQRTKLGVVPVIEKGEEIILESLICGDWIETEYPGGDLIPDTKTALQWRILLAIYEQQVVRIFIKMMWKIDERPKLLETLLVGLKWLEGQLGGQTYFGGEKVGLVDFHIWPWFERFFSTGLDLNEETPKLAKWMTTMRQLPAVQQCEFSQENHTGFLEQYAQRVATGKPIDYDFDLPKITTTSKL